MPKKKSNPAPEQEQQEAIELSLEKYINMTDAELDKLTDDDWKHVDKVAGMMNNFAQIMTDQVVKMRKRYQAWKATKERPITGDAPATESPKPTRKPRKK